MIITIETIVALVQYFTALNYPLEWLWYMLGLVLNQFSG